MQLESINEILESGIKVGMTTSSSRYFTLEEYSSDEIALKLMSLYQTCERFNECLEKVAFQRYTFLWNSFRKLNT